MLYVAVPDFFALLSMQGAKANDIMAEGLFLRLFFLPYAIVFATAIVLMFVTIRLVCIGSMRDLQRD